jgi:hypothetical protein
MTLSIMTLSMMTLSMLTLSMMTLSMMTLSIMTLSITPLSIMVLFVTLSTVKHSSVKEQSSGLYYKLKKIVNDDSRVINKLEALLIDDARFIIYGRHVFIVQATDCSTFIFINLPSKIKPDWKWLQATNTLVYWGASLPGKLLYLSGKDGENYWNIQKEAEVVPQPGKLIFLNALSYYSG